MGSSSKLILQSIRVTPNQFCYFFFTPRNIGMGSSTSAGRVGSFTSPYIVHLVSKYCGVLFGPVRTTESRKRSFSKTLFKPEEFEKPALYFSVDRKRFENDAI